MLTALAALVPAMAVAQTSQNDPAPGTWRYGLSLYGYLPSLSGTSSAPADVNGTPISVDADKLVDSLKFTVMGSFEAHNGRWGLFTDLLYLDLGGNKQQSRDFSLGGALPPSGTTADLDWDFKGTIWTFAGEYRVVVDPTITVDALAGMRWFDVKTTARWSITGNLGPIIPAGRTGSSENKVSIVDGIVGVRGRARLGAASPWSVPFYLDIGTGDSDLTWQAMGGISYSFKWGEITAAWRYLAYDMKPGKTFSDVSFSGPLIGATWRW
jgi:hypothetical protein